MTNEQLKAKHERAAGDHFIEVYNIEKCCNFTFKEQTHPPKPDLIYYDTQQKKTVGLEITDAYYDETDAKQTWDIARGKVSFGQSDSRLNPDLQLTQFINDRIRKKSEKPYNFCHPIILLAVTRPDWSLNGQDFQANVLPHIKLPAHIPFSDIYLDVSFHSRHHYYHLYPI